MFRPTQNLRSICTILILAGATSLVIAEWGHGTSALMFLILLVVSALAGYLLNERSDTPRGLPRSAINLLVVGATFYLFIEAFIFSQHLVICLGHNTILIQACKFLEIKNTRDWGQMVVLSLLQMVVASLLTSHLVFAAMLLLYLALAIYAVVLYHFNCEADRYVRMQVRGGTQVEAKRLVARILAHWNQEGFLGVCIIIGNVSLALGIILFLFVPRGAQQWMDKFRPSRVQSITGFSDSVEFGELGRIIESEKLVMRVKMFRSGKPVMMAEPFFRGVTLDRYDGRRWTRSRTNLVKPWPHLRDDGLAMLPNASFTPFAPNAQHYGYEPADLIQQQYILDPIDSDYIFALYPPLPGDDLDRLRVEKNIQDQTLRTKRPQVETLEYTVVSPAKVSEHMAAFLRTERALAASEEYWNKYAQGVPANLTPRIGELAREIVAEMPDGADRETDINAGIASRIRAYLSNNYHYTLDQSQANPEREPIEDFLFYSKQGHCEYFASAMAILARGAGLRARVVNGFRGGDFNAMGMYYAVRQKHAHSWCEVYLPGKEWVAYDPSPVNIDVGGWGVLEGLGDAFDYFQYQWVRLVISYDTSHRADLFTEVETFLVGKDELFSTRIGEWWAGLWGGNGEESPGRRDWDPAVLLVVFPAIGVVVGAVFTRKRWCPLLLKLVHWFPQRWFRWRRPKNPIAFYQRALRMLNRRGYRVPDGWTARQFAETIASSAQPCFACMPLLAESYYRIRFAGESLSAAEQREILVALEQLKLPIYKDINPQQQATVDSLLRHQC